MGAPIDERVSRGQASERAVCVCEAVSVEKGARRPPLPAAVACPSGGRRRRRLAITADLGLSGRCSVVHRHLSASPVKRSGRKQVPRCSGGVARKESCTACGRTAFTPCRKAHPQQSIRAGGERAAPSMAEQVSARCTHCTPDPLCALLQHACVSPRRARASTVAGGGGVTLVLLHSGSSLAFSTPCWSKSPLGVCLAL